MTWNRPYSVNRLLRMIRSHDFSAEQDFDTGEDDETGEPFNRRIREALIQRREERDFDYDPLYDEEKAEFHVCDVAIMREELRYLRRLERKLVLAVGPQCTTGRYNKKTGKFEDEGLADNFGE